MSHLKKQKIKWFRRYLKASTLMFSPHTSFWVIIFGILWILIAILIFSWKSHLSFSEAIQSEKVAQLGDFIGGVVGSIWALAGVILFYAALTLQRKEFRLQRQELKATRNIFEAQADQLKVQQRENTFFHLIENHRNLVQTLSAKTQSLSSRNPTTETIVGYSVLNTRWKEIEREFKKFKEHFETSNGVFSLRMNSSHNPIRNLISFNEFQSLFISICYMVKFVKEELENSEFHLTTIYMNLSVPERLALGAFLVFKLKEKVSNDQFEDLNFNFLDDYQSIDYYLDTLQVPPIFDFRIVNPHLGLEGNIENNFPKIHLVAEEDLFIVRGFLKHKNLEHDIIDKEFVLTSKEDFEYNLFDFSNKEFWDGKLDEINSTSQSILMEFDFVIIIKHRFQNFQLSETIKLRNIFNAQHGVMINNTFH